MSLTITVQGTTPIPGGPRLVRKRAKIVCDNAYPVAGYDVSALAASFGLKKFKVNDAGTAFLDPVVTGVNQGGVLAEFVALKLLLSFPTGGAATAPATAATAPVGLAGTGVSTASAVDATRPTVGLTPGCGKACPASMDASTITIFADVVGYAA